MTKDEIDAIKQRLKKARPGRQWIDEYPDAPADVGALVAEVERLRELLEDFMESEGYLR